MSKEKQTFLETLDDKAKAFLASINAARIAFNKTKMAAETTKEVKTADGKVLKYTGDTLAVGSVCTLVTDAGEVPASEGDITLEDGTIVTIDAKGTVSEIATKAAEDAESKTEMSKEEFVAMTKDFLSVKDAKEISKAHNASLAKIKDLEIALEKQTEFNLELAETVAKFMALPTDTPIDAGQGGGGAADDFKELTEAEYKELSSFKKHKYDKALREYLFNKKA